MASNSKSDLASSSPDGHAYPNGQRGPYVAASLDRSGSFREGGENHMLFSPPSASRLMSAQMDSIHLLHTLALDFRTFGVDQKISRPDIKRSVSSILGTSPEEPLSTASIGRNSSVSTEEIKRLKVNLSDSSIKARERAKTFGNAMTKIDKCSPNLLRKRSRGDASNERHGALLSGGNISKTGPNSTTDDLEVGSQKGDERVKNSVQNRRIRTSMVDMETRTVGLSRALGPIDRSADSGKLANGGPGVNGEKIRGLATSIDGWEKPKMKKKRSAIKSDASTGVLPSRSVDGDREPKQTVQQKLNNDARARMNNAPGSRSGNVTSGPGTGRVDLLPGQNGIGVRSLNRSDQDNGFQPTSKRDRQAGLDKEFATIRAANKPNSLEDDGHAIATSAKANGSARGPRSNSGSLLKASPNVHRVQGHSDEWEHPSVNKLSSVGGSANGKRTKSTHSLSPPIAQWSGQRPQKISRSARKSNLISPIASTDGALASGPAENVSVTEGTLGSSRRTTIGSHQFKKGDHGQSAGLCESDDTGVAEDKVKDKITKKGELDEDNGTGVQKITTLGHPSKRNKVATDEDLGDVTRRHGRIVRGFTPTRPSTPASVEKLENAPTTKQRSIRTVSERNESKSGRPLVKKSSERKGTVRPRHLVNSAQSESPGQADDDQDELLAAANSVLNTSSAHLIGFWKQVEPIFSFLFAEDTTFLNQQIRLLDDWTTIHSLDGEHSKKYKGNLEYISQPSTPAAGSKDDHNILSDGYGLKEFGSNAGIAWETGYVEPILDQLVQGIGEQNRVSIFQRLLSSLIEEGNECAIYSGCNDEGYLPDTHEFYLEMEGGGKSHSGSYKMESLMSFQTAERGPNGLKQDSGWRYHNELSNKNNLIEKNTMWPEFRYNDMSIDDKILLELSEIGFCPEPVPDLAQSEDEYITDEICKLEDKLDRQVMEEKKLLVKVEQVVKTARESQHRQFSQRALEKLVLAAYEKYMASKNMNRAGKQAALAFVRRTLARCHNFEGMGVSCFDEPAFRDLFILATSHRSDADSSQEKDTNGHFPHSQDHKRANASDKSSDMSRATSSISEMSFGKEDPWTNNVKQRELLLDEVVGSFTGNATLRGSGLGTSLANGTKGKRSERDREGKGHGRDGAKSGRSSSLNAKGERKNKTKPKQKTVQLSAEFNTKLVPLDNVKKENPSSSSRYNEVPNASNEEDLIDLSSLPIPGMEIDVTDFGTQGQDFDSFFSLDDDHLQDLEGFMDGGLEIPMDDLSDVHLMI